MKFSFTSREVVSWVIFEKFESRESVDMGNRNSTPESLLANELTEVSNENQPLHEVILLGYDWEFKVAFNTETLETLLVLCCSIDNFRFTFEVAGIKEIHTEVYAYGYIFSFAMDVGFKCSPVSRHWLWETTKRKFGEYSATEEAIGQWLNNYINHIIRLNSEEPIFSCEDFFWTK